MSFSVINKMQETIKGYIEEIIPEFKSEDSAIVFDSPANVIASNKGTTLVIYLYHQERNQYFSSLRIKHKEMKGNHNKKVIIMPAKLDNLYYMFTVYNKDISKERQIIEKIIAYFEPMISNSQCSLTKYGITKINIESNDLSLNDICEIWLKFPNRSLKLSLFYKVSPIYRPQELEEEGTKILDKEISLNDIKEINMN